MLAFQLDSDFLDLYPDTSVSVNWLSPLFDRESFERLYTYPFKVPASPKNKRLFQFAHRLDNRNTQKKYSGATLYIDGEQIDTGILEVTEPNTTEYELVFKNTSLYLAEQLKKIKLAEQLDLTVTVSDDYCPDQLWRRQYPTDSPTTIQFIFQVNDDIFYAIVPNLDDLVNEINSLYADLAEVYDNNTPIGEGFALAGIRIKNPGCNDITVTTPQEPDSSFYNFGFVGNLIDNEITRIQSDWITHLDSTLDGTATHAFPTVKTPNLYSEENNPEFETYVNYYKITADYILNAFDYGVRWWKHAIIPFFKSNTVLDRIAALLPSVISGVAGDWYEDEEIEQLLIWNNRPLDYLIEQFDGINRNVWALNFKLKNHVPDITAHDYLLKLSSTFCLYFSSRSGKLEINPCKKLLTLPPEDWTSKAEPDYKQTLPDAVGFTLDYDRQDDKTEYPFQLDRLDGGVDAQEFISQWYTLHYLQEFDEIEPTRSWIIPVINDGGTSDIYGVSNKPSLRLFFYRGLQPSQLFENGSVVGNEDYPLASHNVRNRDNVPVGNYSLDWKGEGSVFGLENDSFGLYQVWWKDYINLLLNGRSVTRPMRLTVNDLIRLRNLELTRLRIYSPDGEMIGVAKSVSAKASVKFGLEISQVELIREP